MARIALTFLVAVAVVGVVTEAIPWPTRGFPLPTPSCQRWCPRPGQPGQYDCCEGQPSCPAAGGFTCEHHIIPGTCRAACRISEFERPSAGCGSCKCCV
ncbi:unnamed protein product [Meganyctiphanes norvegica]|uniref:Uncharacterized protein n=1 Tax=Meganyctiphanes norvegica TaxID=48144 RepID=A0AAV2S6R1_MEGNR